MGPAQIFEIQKINMKGKIGMKKRIVSVVLVLALALCAFPFSAFADSQEVNREANIEVASDNPNLSNKDIILKRSNVMFRKRPNRQCESWGQLQSGERIHVIEDACIISDGEKWSRVSARGHVGYVASYLLWPCIILG